MGATCVTTPVTGHDEYVVHGWNASCATGTTRAAPRGCSTCSRATGALLHFLRSTRSRPRAAWPSWEQAAQFMALALQRIHRAPPPPGDASARGDARRRARPASRPTAATLAERAEYGAPVERVERVKALPGVRQARGAWRQPARAAQRRPVVAAHGQAALGADGAACAPALRRARWPAAARARRRAAAARRARRRCWRWRRDGARAARAARRAADGAAARRGRHPAVPARQRRALARSRTSCAASRRAGTGARCGSRTTRAATPARRRRRRARSRRSSARSRAPVRSGFAAWGGADVVVATGWQTVHRVLRLPGRRGRAPTSCRTTSPSSTPRRPSGCGPRRPTAWACTASARARGSPSWSRALRRERDARSTSASTTTPTDPTGGRGATTSWSSTPARSPRAARCRSGCSRWRSCTAAGPGVEIALFGESAPIETRFPHTHAGVLGRADARRALRARRPSAWCSR